MEMCIIRSICGLEHCYFVRDENKTQCSLKAVRTLEACLVAEHATQSKSQNFGKDKQIGDAPDH
jgi:hypothetical protein